MAIATKEPEIVTTKELELLIPVKPEAASVIESPIVIEPLVVTWLYYPEREEIRSRAPFIIQYPPNTDKARADLGNHDLARSNNELPMEQLVILPGRNEVPLTKVRAINSHPASAGAIERRVMNSVIEVLEIDFADIEGVSTDRAFSIHYVARKAIAMINATYSLEDLKMWRARETATDRKVVRDAIDKRIKAITEEINERTAAELSNYLAS